jgi:hypothetical protein
MEFSFRAMPADAVEVSVCKGENSSEDMLEAVAEVVDDDYIVAGFQKFQYCVTTDESEAAGDENKLVVFREERGILEKFVGTCCWCGRT